MMFNLHILMVCLLTLLLTACGGGGSGSNSKKSTSSSSSSSSVVSTTTTSYYGIFQGSTVVGVYYKAELNGQIKEGKTDSEGKFQYFENNGVISPVTFSVGGVTLGTVTPSPNNSSYTMNAFDLVDINDPDASTKAINIQRFLSSINTSTQTNIIEIPPTIHTSLAGEKVLLNQTPIADFDTKAKALIDSLISTSALPLGTALTTATAITTHINETKSQIDALRIGGFTILSGTSAVLADGKTKVLIRVEALTNNNLPLAGGLVHFETTAGTLGTETDLCSATTTTTTSVDKVTDANGMAYVMLTPRCQTANAVVSAYLGGKIIYKPVQFTPGPAIAANSTITINPKTLPADGLSTATVTLSLRDANNNPIADNTPVTLSTSAGSLQASTASTTSGRATFTFIAANTNNTATLSVNEYSFLSDTLSMGVVSSTGGKPNSIQISSGLNQIFVGGVGKTENTGISIQIKDDVGDPINESTLGYATNFNNLRVTMKTRPQGGETIAGIGRTATAMVSTDVETKKSSAALNSIDIRTTNGSATITLTAGPRPGIVEFLVQALDTDGTTVLASAVSPLVTVASGPPHTITLSEAYKDGLVNMKDFGRGGVYCRLGSALITDRYGNAVPDKTTIALNLMDTVLASGTTGSITAGSVDLTDNSATFSTNSITMAGLARTIQSGDQILIEQNVQAEDRRRFVSNIISNTAIAANASYIKSYAGLTYYVGASLHGGAIHGFSGQQSCDPTQLTTGVATTIGGIAPIRVTYPASTETIQLGCANYATDSRFPNQSGQVLIIAAVNDVNDTSNSGSTLITRGKFCFSAQSPTTLTPYPSTFSQGNNQSLTLYLVDNGAIPIPNVTTSCTASLTSNTSGNLSITVSPTDNTTNTSGIATFATTITGGGGATADTGTITCTGYDATTTIAVIVP